MLSNTREYAHGSYGFAFAEPTPPLSIQLRAVGWEHQTAPDYDWDGMKRRRDGDSLLFQYTLNGSGRIDFAGQSYRLEREDGFLVRIPSEHRYYLPPESQGWEFVYIMLRGSAIADLWPQVAHTAASPVQRYAPDHPAVRVVMNACRDSANRSIRDVYQASGIAYQFMMELIRTSEWLSGPPDERPKPVRKAIAYMRDNYAVLNGLDDLGQAAGLSKYHFARLFHKSTGLTPVQYWTNVRMEKAVELLRLTNLTMDEIAASVGYANGNYFCKVFRQRIGTTPGDFRSGKAAAPVDHILLG